jgi:hypothetical protein
MHVELKEEQQLLRDSMRRAMAQILTPDRLRRIGAAGLYPYEAYDAWLKHERK